MPDKFRVKRFTKREMPQTCQIGRVKASVKEADNAAGSRKARHVAKPQPFAVALVETRFPAWLPSCASFKPYSRSDLKKTGMRYGSKILR